MFDPIRPQQPVRRVAPITVHSEGNCRQFHSAFVQPLPGLRDVRIVLGGLSAIWVTVALVTFHPLDNSTFNYVLPFELARNWCGTWGAEVAAFLYVLLGVSSWGMVAVLSTFVIPRPDMSYAQVFGRACSGFICVGASAALASLGGFTFRTIMGGGIVGKELLWLSTTVGVTGAALLYVGVAVMSGLIFLQLTAGEALGLMVRAVHIAVALVRYAWRRVNGLFSRESAKSESNVDHTHHYGVHETPEQDFHYFDDTKEKQRPITHEPVLDVYENVPQKSPQQEAVIIIPHHHPAHHNHTNHEVDQLGDVVIDDIAEAAPAVQAEETTPQAHVIEEEAVEAQSWESFFSETAPSTEEDTDEIEVAKAEHEAVVHDVVVTHEVREEVMATSGVQETGEADETVEDDVEEEPADEREEDEEDDESEGIEYKQFDVAAAAIAHPFVLPDMGALFHESVKDQDLDDEFLARCQERGRILEEKLTYFGVSGRVIGIRPGPVITLFEYEPEVGSKVSKILSLEDDLALSLKALSIRILAPVPGMSVVGFEIANEKRNSVTFSEVAGRDGLQGSKAHLPLALGVDIVGNPVIADLATMPHLLVAGATGSGKSVGMNVMLVSLLARVSPDRVRVILIDPKRLEFAPYADVPHLLFPIVTNPYEVAPVLKWVAEEMELRYELMAQMGVRNIADYHKLDREECLKYEREIGIKVPGMPYMVIMIDELADLMMVAGREIETLIARIAQMARAAGIHMLVATQRPSVDIVTGLIKANFPSRIAFRVSTKIDSRTIIDAVGAEKLLGKGDMLYMSPASVSGLQRLHGAYVTDEEIEALTSYLKEQREVCYFSLRKIIAQHSEQDEFSDPLYDEVKEFINSIDEVSISMLQRKYRVGFNRSARLIEMLERDGFVAPAQGGKPRRVLRDE